MFFKNLSIFKIAGEYKKLTAQDLTDALQKNPFSECLATQTFNSGFVSPIENDDRLVITIKPKFFAFCLQRQEKIIPSSAIKNESSKRIKELENSGEKLDKKAQAEIKENICVELTTRALSKIEKTMAYFDCENGWLVIDTASSKKAEHLISKLRLAFGCEDDKLFSATPLKKALKKSLDELESAISFDLFVRNFSDFSLEKKFILKSEESKKISYSDDEINESMLKDYLFEGMKITQIGLEFKNRMEFILNNAFVIKNVMFSQLSKNEYSIEYDNKIDQFITEMFLTVSEVAELLNALVAGFGGLKE